jgi:Fe-S cluster biogenesis protein NfuA
LHSGIRLRYNEMQRSGGEIVVRRVEDRYQSGLVDVLWIGECRACSAHVRVAREALARQWETAHAHYPAFRS